MMAKALVAADAKRSGSPACSRRRARGFVAA